MHILYLLNIFYFDIPTFFSKNFLIEWMSHVETMVSFILWHLAIYPRAVCEGQDGLMKNPGSHELTGPGLGSNFSSSPPGLPPYLAA